MASNNHPDTSQALPGLPVIIKQEPEEFKYTPALFEDDGLDDEFYGHNEEVKLALMKPDGKVSSYIADDDDLAFAGHDAEDVPQPEFRGPAKGQATALTMRPATSTKSAPAPAPQMRRATMPKPNDGRYQSPARQAVIRNHARLESPSARRFTIPDNVL
ncbi:hypothetical protein LTR15_002860 [Elasticomyces elasticus]|nr:hypothetical protein LTR15_002860 [Elasticomyces elasticus]